MGIEHEVKEQRELIASLMLENAALRNTSAKQETEIEQLNSELLAERLANIGKVHPCDDSTAVNLASALADNERLREENNKLRSDAVALQDMRQKAEAEIERLGKERDSAFETWKALHVTTLNAFIKNEHEPLKAEIERLRNELAQWKRAADEGHQQPCTLGPLCPYCDIERLRMELTKVGNGSYNPALVLAEQEAENERLLCKLQAHVRLVGELSQKIKDNDAEIEQMQTEARLRDHVLQEVAGERNKLRIEIERKRGLLREHLLGPTEVMTWRQAHEWHEDYLKRVREELGDE